MSSKYGLVPSLQKLSPGGELDFREVPCSKNIKSFEKWKKQRNKKDVFYENAKFVDPDDIGAPWSKSFKQKTLRQKPDVLDRFLNDDDDDRNFVPGNVPGEEEANNYIPSITKSETYDAGKPKMRKTPIEERIREANQPSTTEPEKI